MERRRAGSTQGRQFDSGTNKFDNGRCEFHDGAHEFDCRTPEFEQGAQQGVRLHRRVRGGTAVHFLSPADARCNVWTRLKSNYAGAA